MNSDERLELLRQLAPTLHFDALERWRPSPVDRYLEWSAVLDGKEQRLPNTPPAEPALSEQGDDLKAQINPLKSKPDGKSQKRSNEMLAAFGKDQDLAGAGMAYGRVAGSRRGVLFLQYWLFYADNPCVIAPGRHDGDWELVQIRVERSGADFRATHLTLAEHGKPVSAPIASAADPIDVYVAVDSHACYFEPGANPIIPLSDVCEPTDDTGAKPLVELLPIASDKRDWAHWSGRWGMDRGPGTWLALKLRLKRTPSLFKWLNKVGAGESPPSPGHQGMSWSSPRAFAARGTGRRASIGLLQRFAHFLGHATWPNTPPRVEVTPVDDHTYAIEATAAGRFLRRVSRVSVAFWEERPDGSRRALAMQSLRPGHPVRVEIPHQGKLAWRAAGYNWLRQRGRPVQ